MKKILQLFPIAVLLLFCASGVSAKETIPEILTPDTAIEYDEQCLPVVIDYEEFTESRGSAAGSASLNLNRVTGSHKEDTSGLAKEEAIVAKILEEVKNLPSYDLGYSLPAPQPGMVVVYGSDGLINHIYLNGEEYTGSGDIQLSAILPRGTRKPAGTYSYGNLGGGRKNVITISSNQVLGVGRGTVFDDAIGDHDNYLQTGDCATKGEIDNPWYGTVIGVRNLDNDIRKDLYKNDVGGLPNAVIDIWRWDYQYFGEYYSSTLSFPNMRYWYPF